jgi:hypothetical protein
MWFPEDVHQCCEDMELGELSVEEADEVLRRMEKYHDCNYGDDWDSMAGYIRDVMGERAKKDEQYTVVGYYEDNGQSWATLVKAKSPMQAAAEGVRDIAVTNEQDEVCDIHVVEVLEGDCKCTAVTQSVMNGDQVYGLARDEGWK